MAFIDLISSFHFWVMTIAMITSILAAYFAWKKQPKNWYLYHRITTPIGGLFAIIGLLIVGFNSITGLHPILGIIAIALLIMGIGGGFFIYLKKKYEMRSFHLWMGRLTALLLTTVWIIGISILL